MKKYIFLFLCFLCPFISAETVSDTLEIRVDIPPFFSLSVETFMVVPDERIPASELLEPSQNVMSQGASLNNTINLGHLIARKKDREVLPLISEYKVVLKAKCDTNKGNSYTLIQTLDAPLTGDQTGEVFPLSAFVCTAAIDQEEGTPMGNVFITEETPVVPGSRQIIYESPEAGFDYIGNVIDIFYWVSDQQEDKVFPDQKSDVYKSSITFTMIEL